MLTRAEKREIRIVALDAALKIVEVKGTGTSVSLVISDAAALEKYLLHGLKKPNG